MAHTIDSHSLPYAPDKCERKDMISFEQFLSVDMRTGTVIDVEDYHQMRKPSYKITVDFGPVVGTLQSSAQITNYSTQELINRKVVGAINLGEKMLPGGFVSQFLVLGALEPDGTVRLLDVDPSMANGSTIL
jgi:tRNA-binding protein